MDFGVFKHNELSVETQMMCMPAVPCVPAMTDRQLRVVVMLMHELAFLVPTNTDAGA